MALYGPPRLHLAVAEPEPPVVGRAARGRSAALARGVRRDQRDVLRQALADLAERADTAALDGRLQGPHRLLTGYRYRYRYKCCESDKKAATD